MSNSETPSRSLKNSTRGFLLVLGILSLVIGCSVIGLSGTDRSVEVAENLHSAVPAGFSAGAIDGPDNQLQQAFGGARTGSGFSMVSQSGEIGLKECQAMIRWAEKQIDGVLLSMQVNKTPDNISAAVASCVLAPPEEFSLVGTYGSPGPLVIISKGYDNDFRIYVRLLNGQSPLEWTNLNPYEEFEGITLFISTLRAAQTESATTAPSDETVAQIWKSLEVELGGLADVTWQANQKGEVEYVHFDFGPSCYETQETPGALCTRSDIKPICVSVKPWNVAELGPEPKAPYLVYIQQEFNNLSTFGSSTYGDCPK